MAHVNYVRVINSDNIDSLASMFTEDVVFLAAGDQPMVGKPATGGTWRVARDAFGPDHPLAAQ
jgi:ketosteroid isomerase-like protein